MGMARNGNTSRLPSVGGFGKIEWICSERLAIPCSSYETLLAISINDTNSIECHYI
jgi:hypothetical protein